MKISIIGPVYPYRGGISHYNTALCRELIASGHQVQVISFKRQYPAWLYPGQSDMEPGGQFDPAWASYRLDPLYPWTWWQALREVFSFRPNLVLIQWWTTFLAPAFFVMSWMLKRRGVNCVFTIHNVYPHEKRRIDQWLAHLVLSNGSGFITLSPREGQRLTELIASARIYPSHLPVPQVFMEDKSRVVLRKEMNLPVDGTILLSFGIIRPYKGLHVLLDALALLKDKGLTPHVLVAGEFWEDIEVYRKRISDLALTDQVTLENRYIPNEELARFFSAADVFVAPYIQGTQSGAIKMAMGFRLPILASDQISGDLPVTSYPILVHQAGSAEDLARSIETFSRQPRVDRVEQAVQNDWVEIISLIEKIGTDLC